MCRVLILDDDFDSCESLKEALSAALLDQNYQVSGVIQVEQALQEARRAADSGKPFDFFLIDQRLGSDLDGIEVMRRLFGFSPHSEAIVFTGLENPDDGWRAYQAGAAHYLPKPVNIMELVWKLRSLDQQRKVLRERDWLQTFSQVAEQALGCAAYSEAAKVIARGALELGFERVHLLEYSLDQPEYLIGVHQAGKDRLPGSLSFAGHRLHIADSPYLSRAVLSREALFFIGQEYGPGVMEKTFGKAFKPPAGEWAILPLWIGDKFTGLLVLENISASRRIRADDHRQLRLFTRLAAGNLERTRLFELERQETRQLQLLQRAGEELLRIANVDEDKFWLTLLTLATASYGLGFNRAWVFLAEAGGTRLRGRLGVGHLEHATAHRDWEKDVAVRMDFETFLARLKAGALEPTPLEKLTTGLQIPLNETDGAFEEVLQQGNRLEIRAEAVEARLPAIFRTLFNPGARDKPTACAVLPLRVGGAAAGLVVVDNQYDDRPIQANRLDRLETFLNIAGLVWQNLTQRRQREAVLEAAYAILRRASLQELGETLRTICEAARAVTGADWAIIYPVAASSMPGETTGSALTPEYDARNIGYAGEIDPRRLKQRPGQSGVSAHILRTGTLIVGDVLADTQVIGARVLAEHRFIRHAGIRALVGTPVFGVESGERLGLLYLDYHTPQPLGRQDVLQAESFANLAGVAILNARYAEATRRGLQQAEERGEASRRELEIQQQVLRDVLQVGSETEVIQILLANIRRLFDRAELEPALVIQRWQAGAVNEEPHEYYVWYSLRPEGLLAQEIDPTRETLEATGCADIPRVLNRKPFRVIRKGRKLFAPVHHLDAPIGVLAVEFERGSLRPEYRSILERFASIAAQALDNVRRQAHLFSVLRAANQVNKPVDLEPTLQSIIHAIREISPDLSAFTLWYRDPGDASQRQAGQLQLGNVFGIRDPERLRKKSLEPDSAIWSFMHARVTLWEPVLRKSDRLGRLFGASEGIVSAAAFPLQADDEEVGAMFFLYRRRRRFLPEEKALFGILAQSVAGSLRDAIFVERMQRDRKRLGAALGVAEAVGAQLDLDAVLHHVLAQLSHSFRDAVSCVMLYNEDDQTLDFAPASIDFFHIDNPQYQALQSLQIFQDRAIACRVARRSLKENRIVVENIPDVWGDADYLPAIDTTRSEICASLFSADSLLGVLVLERPYENGFEVEDKELVRAAALQVSLAIARAWQSLELNYKNAVATRTAWAADLAHDFNREIGAVRNLAYLVRAVADQPEKVVEYARQIEESAVNLISATPWSGSPMTVELDPFIEQWTTTYARNRKEGITVSFDLRCRRTKVLVNPLALQRVLRHLVRNAAQAMENAPLRQLKVRSSSTSDGMVEIQFEDSGPGVDEAIRSRLFQRQASTKHEEGGFGLLLTRQMVEDVGGRIRLLPGRPGGGATFSIKIPAWRGDRTQSGSIQ